MFDNGDCASVESFFNTAYPVAVKSNPRSTDFAAVVAFEGRICWRLRWWLVSLFLPFMLTLFIIFLRPIAGDFPPGGPVVGSSFPG